MSLMNELNAEIAASLSSWDSVLKVPEGEKVKLRFLCNMDQGVKFLVHGRWIDGDPDAGYTVPCASLFKVDGMPRFCPFCQIPEDKQTGSKNFFGWLIWNYNAGKIQAFAFKANKTTPLAWLSEFYEDHKEQQGLLGRDFTLKRDGKGYAMTHTMSSLDPSEFRPGVRINVPQTTAQIQTMILKLFAEKHYPALLRPGELLVPATKQSNASVEDSLTNAFNGNGSGGQNGQYKDEDLQDADDLLPQNV